MAKRKLVLANNPLLSGPKFDERERSGIPYRELSLSLLDRDPNQPRVNFDEEKLQELSDSIKIYGVLSPIIVRPGKILGRYTIVSGERRFRAAQLSGLTTVPVLIDQEADDNGQRTLAMQLVENLQRADLTSLERAHAIGALKETHNLSVRDVAEKLSISKSMVQRSLEILELPDDLLNALREGASESKILLLSKIDDPEIRANYLKDLDVLTRGRIKEELEKDSEEDVKAPPSALTAEDQRIADEIQRSLGLKVRMIRNKTEPDHGRLVIDFYSSEDLQEIFRKLVTDT